MNYFSDPIGKFRISFLDTDTDFNTNFGCVNQVRLGNYDLLTNKPSINNVVLQGDLSAEDLGLGKVYCDTTVNWNAQPSLISEKGTIYIYSDYYTIEDEVGNKVSLAGIRIGDGSAYLIDLPFIGDNVTALLIKHMMDPSVHVTKEEKDCWNNKVSVLLDENDNENLIFSTDCTIDPNSDFYSSLVGFAIVDHSNVGAERSPFVPTSEKCFDIGDEMKSGDLLVNYIIQ